MFRKLKSLRFLWWNLQSFAHYDAAREGERRWPSNVIEFQAKCDRLIKVLRAACGKRPLELLAFAEITRKAAEELQRQALPKHRVLSLDLLPESEFQVAFLYDSRLPFTEQSPLVKVLAPRGTRPMGVLDLVTGACRIRFIACHWQSRFTDESKHTRSDLANFLNTQIYDFLHGDEAEVESRHVVILGDLNEEPFGMLEERLHAFRDRAHSRAKEHYTDEDVKRVRLYNCSWRFLGERTPHDATLVAAETAGTYFWDNAKTWHTFDHVIVTGSLLQATLPCLDETSLAVVVTPAIMGEESPPRSFQMENGNPLGVSDHLPIVGRIIVP